MTVLKHGNEGVGIKEEMQRHLAEGTDLHDDEYPHQWKGPVSYTILKGG